MPSLPAATDAIKNSFDRMRADLRGMFRAYFGATSCASVLAETTFLDFWMSKMSQMSGGGEVERLWAPGCEEAGRKGHQRFDATEHSGRHTQLIAWIVIGGTDQRRLDFATAMEAEMESVAVDGGGGRLAFCARLPTLSANDPPPLVFARSFCLSRKPSSPPSSLCPFSLLSLSL